MDDEMDDRTDGWKGRPPTTTGQNQGYYIRRLAILALPSPEFKDNCIVAWD
jgi:hypothetical protein